MNETETPPPNPDERAPDGVDRGLAEAFGAAAAPASASVLRILQARTRSQLGVHLDATDSDDAPVKITPEVKQLRDPSGRYQLLGEIGRGGVGTVYKGRDQDLGRDVAMKVLKDEFAQRPDVLARFVEEAQIGGQLQHPGIVPVYELGLQAGERPYFAMKLVKGETLAAQLARRKAPHEERRRLLGVFEQVCQTIAYAHTRRVVHRDLKPANVMIGAFGEVQVVDWGFAKVLPRGGVADEVEAVERASAQSVIETVRSAPDAGSKSVAGSMLGTPAYMPPEQALGDVARVDRRSDVFSLGAILCELLTGEAPYRAADGDLVRQAASAALDGAHARLRACGAEESLVQLCIECLSPARRARPESATELADRVGQYLTSVEERARRAREEAAATRYRHRVTLLSAAAGLLVLGSLGGAWLWNTDQARQRQEDSRRSITTALNAATIARGKAQATRGGLDLTLWDAALASVENALEMAKREDSAPDLLAETETLLVQVHRERAAARLTEQLEELRIPIDDDVRQAGWLPRELARLDEGYDVAFSEYLGGPSLLARDLELSREEFSPRVSALLAASLDHWALVRDARQDPDATQASLATARLRSLASQLDPEHEGRNALRAIAPRAAQDPEAVRELAPSLDLEDLSPPGCRVLHETLLLAGLEHLAVQTLRRSLEVHPDDFDLTFRLAVQLELMDPPRWEEAVDTYRIAYALCPEHDEVLHRWGLALKELERHEDAERVTLLLHLRRPRDVHFFRHHAETFADRGRHEEALDLLERCLALDPENSFTLNTMGRTLKDMGEVDRAITLYRRAIAAWHGNADAHTNLGNALSERGQHAEAVEHSRKAVAIDPADDRYLQNLGAVHKNRLGEEGELSAEDLAEAEDCLARALEVRPREPDLPYVLGDLDLYQGNLEEAEEHYAHALRLDGDHANSLHGLGLLRLRQRSASEAIALLRKAAELQPRFLFQWDLTKALEMSGRLDEALTAAEEATRLDPADASGWTLRGEILFSLGEDAEAEEILATAIDVDPDNASAICLLGLLEERRGNDTEALERYAQAVDLDPDFHGFRTNYGRLLQKFGQWEKAIEQLETARSLDSHDAASVTNLGFLRMQQGRVDDAVALYLEALERDPNIVEPYMNLAAIHLERGELQEARALHEEVVARFAGHQREAVRRMVAAVREALEGLDDLDAALSGEIETTSAQEWQRLAQAATLVGRHREVVEWTEETLRGKPALLEVGPDSLSWGLYNSACCAARLAFDDAADLPPEERHRLRRLAHDWLLEEIDRWIGWAAMEDQTSSVARSRLSHSLNDADFASLRGSALESLGPVEREAWRKLWADVEAALADEDH